MKKLLPLVCFVLLAISCKEEKDVDPANTSTFKRLFGSEHNHTAVLALEANDGFSLLSNMDIAVNELGDFQYQIRFIHTDRFGNSVWTREYPGFEALEEAAIDENNKLDGFTGASFLPVSDGYLIIGDRIYDDGKTTLLLMKINLSGEVEWTVDHELDPAIHGDQAKLHGRGITLAGDDLMIVGSITDSNSSTDMYVAKINLSDRSLLWSREYGSGTATVVNRLFTNGGTTIYWGGSVSDLRPPGDVRLIVAPENSLTSNMGNLCCDAAKEESAMDFCETLGGFAFVGGSKDPEQDNDIFFTKITPAGVVVSQPQPFDFDGLDDVAASICPAVDGGYMILATVTTGPTRGNGKEDYFLYKVDDQGRPLTSDLTTYGINYGGSDNDEAASIRTTSDGSYIVFGTSTFGSVKKLMLMKVNEEGKL